MKLDKNYKVRVTPEQSRQIQELLFALGGGWFGGRDGKEPIMLNADYLFLHSSMVLTYAYERGNCYFENKPNYTEIQADDLIALLTDLQKSAENPLENMKLTPEFQVGDKVYCLLQEPKIFTILEVDDDNTAHFGESGKFGYRWWSFKNLCHATTENYERLQATFTDIEFEHPPKPLMGSALARAMARNGHKYIVGKCGDYIGVFWWDEDAQHFFDMDGTGTFDVEPIDPKTGEPLTEAVLDEN